ncbi:hypothetical protein [Actinomadura rudentiformis]|uniref:Uncharacterized protein n=1 Tax=Actinomadura rudentiformis TaxID=359158 RepID=A0A6H9YTI7_9ACTN|nr:hypothetical protein [Actinomadura rudentiformis]KAB2346804.1 hypothetical protein F8566_21490 [Actinomadura rudentiformis]
MTAHLSDSDRQALRLAHDLREEMRLALPPHGTAVPAVSPFVDPAGRPSVLMRMDADTARALMALLGERRAEQAVPPEPRRADGSHVPPSAPAVAGAPMAPMARAAHSPLLPTTFPAR